MPYDTVEALRAEMYKVAPVLAGLEQQSAGAITDVEALAGLGGNYANEPFGSVVADFYLTNPIARASAVMAELSAMRRKAETPVAAE